MYKYESASRRGETPNHGSSVDHEFYHCEIVLSRGYDVETSDTTTILRGGYDVVVSDTIPKEQLCEHDA